MLQNWNQIDSVVQFFKIVPKDGANQMQAKLGRIFLTPWDFRSETIEMT